MSKQFTKKKKKAHTYIGMSSQNFTHVCYTNRIILINGLRIKCIKSHIVGYLKKIQFYRSRFRFVALQFLKRCQKESLPLVTGCSLSRATILVALQTREWKRALSLVILCVCPSVWIERRDTHLKYFCEILSPGLFRNISILLNMEQKTSDTLHEDLLMLLQHTAVARLYN
jgi:hypothetical protein